MLQIEDHPKVQLEDLNDRMRRPLGPFAYSALATYLGLTGVQIWSNFYGPFLTAAEVVIAIGYALLTLFLRGFLIGSDFARVRNFQRVLSSSYFVAGFSLPVLVAVSFLLRFPGPTPALLGVPLWSPIILLLGLAFFTLGISLPWVRLFDPDSAGRLSLLQFLVRTEGSDLQFRWLRDGLGSFQRKMSRSGLSIPENSLFLGAGYGLANGMVEDSDILELSQWVDESDVLALPPAAMNLVSLAKEATEEGFERPHSWVEHLFGTRNLVQNAITLIAGLLAILVSAHSLGLF